MRQQFIFVNLVGQNSGLRWRILLLIILVTKSSSKWVQFWTIDLGHVLHVYSDVVLDVDDIFDRFLALLAVSNKLLNLDLLNLWHTDHEVGKQLELCLELVFFTNLISGCVNVLDTSLQRAEHYSLKWSWLDSHIIAVKLVQYVECYDSLALWDQLNHDHHH